jgi:hypothetical protein
MVLEPPRASDAIRQASFEASSAILAAHLPLSQQKPVPLPEVIIAEAAPHIDLRPLSHRTDHSLRRGEACALGLCTPDELHKPPDPPVLVQAQGDKPAGAPAGARSRLLHAPAAHCANAPADSGGAAVDAAAFAAAAANDPFHSDWPHW